MLLSYQSKVDVIDDYGFTPLHLCCLNGHQAVAEMLIDNGINVNAKDSMGRTPLIATVFRSSSSKYIDLFHYLLEKGANPKIVDKNGRGLLIWCVSGYGYLSMIQVILENHPPIDEKDNLGRQAMHYAALHGNIEVVHMLSEFGADIDCQDNNGQTPLHASIRHPMLVEQFIRSKIDVYITDKEKRNAMHLAMMEGQSDTFLRILGGAIDFSIDSKDIYGRTIFHYAAWSNTTDSIMFLLELGADPLSIDNKGRNLLHFASQRGNSTFLAALEREIPKHVITHLVHQKDINGFTPLHFAASYNSPECAFFILDFDADIGLCSKNGQTAIHIAALKGNKSTLRALLHVDSESIDVCDASGAKAIHLAIQSGSIDCCELLVDNGSSWTDKDRINRNGLFYCNSITIAELLLEKGLSLNDKDALGNDLLTHYIHNNRTELTLWLLNEKNIEIINRSIVSLVHVAAHLGNSDILEALLEHGVDAKQKDDKGRTPFLYACAGGDIHCVTMLYEKIPSFIDLRDNKGRSPLDVAAINGSTKVVEYLIEKLPSGRLAPAKDGRTVLHSGVYNFSSTNSKDTHLLKLLLSRSEVNMVDNNGRSALHRSVYYNNVICSEFLIHNGARVDLPDNNGITPLMMASRRGSIDCILLLVKNKADNSLKDNEGLTAIGHWKKYHKDSKTVPIFPRDDSSSVELEEEMDEWITCGPPSPEVLNKSGVQSKDADSKIVQYQNEITSLKERISLLSEVLSDSQDKEQEYIAQLEKQETEHEMKMDEIKNEFEDYKHSTLLKMKDLETKSNHQEQLIESLRSQLEKVNEELKEEKTKNESLSNTIESITFLNTEAIQNLKYNLFEATTGRIKATLLYTYTKLDESFYTTLSTNELYERFKDESIENWAPLIYEALVEDHTIHRQ